MSMLRNHLHTQGIPSGGPSIAKQQVNTTASKPGLSVAGGPAAPARLPNQPLPAAVQRRKTTVQPTPAKQTYENNPQLDLYFRSSHNFDVNDIPVIPTRDNTAKMAHFDNLAIVQELQQHMISVHELDLGNDFPTQQDDELNLEFDLSDLNF